MEFKYHKAYKGYYLIENGKFKRPYKKLDKILTKKNLEANSVTVNFDNDSVLNIADKYVVFFDKDNKSVDFKNKKNKTVHNLAINSNLENIVPNTLINKLLEYIEYQEGVRDINTINSVFEIIENIVYADGLFKNKARKTFYYKKELLINLFDRYLPTKKINADFKKEIIENYPSQYVYEHLPLDYKEKEMIYVFYFIMFIELLSILK